MKKILIFIIAFIFTVTLFSYEISAQKYYTSK